jgi:hypothetical protein
MRKLVLPIIAAVLVLGIGGFVIKQKFLQPAQAGLQVSSNPPATIFLDEKEMGMTPQELKDLKPGEKTLKLVPQSTATTYFPWETKIKLINGMVAVVSRDFGETESASAGEVMTLEKIADKKSASLAVISLPDSAVVTLNNETKGFTPVNLDGLAAGNYEVRVSANGYQERMVRVKLDEGYKLMVNIKLAEEKQEEEKTEEEEEATVTGTPTPEAKVTPKTTPPPKPYVLIKDTPTGWLRVRMEPSITATEAAKVNPGEMYPLLDEESGWYQIEYQKDEEGLPAQVGWISGQYAEKYE